MRKTLKITVGAIAVSLLCLQIPVYAETQMPGTAYWSNAAIGYWWYKKEPEKLPLKKKDKKPEMAINVEKTQPKKFKVKFEAKGTREQLEKLIAYMGDNGIEYRRI